MRNMYESWLEVVSPIIREVGHIAHKKFRFGRINAGKKAGGEWVTDTDRDVEDLIIERLQRHFPDHSFLGEETGASGDSEKHCWVIDPLDGTTNYVHSLPNFVITIAYCNNGKVRLALVYDFLRDELFTTVYGKGAYMNNQRLRVSKEPRFSQSLCMVSGQTEKVRLWSFVSSLAPQVDGVRRTGSTVLDLAWLAAGRVDAVVCGPVKYWDIAAGTLLVKESGGMIAPVGEEKDFIFGEPVNGLVATPPRIFVRYLSAMESHLKTL